MIHKFVQPTVLQFAPSPILISYGTPQFVHQKKTCATGIGRKVKAPEIWQELVVWFVDIQKALKGYLPKQLFKMKVKQICANWLEQFETLLEE